MIICPLCQSFNVELKLNDNRFQYILYKCIDCKVIFKQNSPIVNYKNLPFDMFKIYNFPRRKEVHELIKIINSNYEKVKNLSILEIGSGTGSLLNEFKYFGILDLTGVEPSETASDYSKTQYKLNIINGYLCDLLYEKKFDVILIYDVIEHLHNPDSLFKSIHKYINKEGIIIIKSGDTNSVNANIFPREWQYYQSNQHVCFYNKTSIKNALIKYNLVVKEFYRFKDAYGGFHFFSLIKNIILGLSVRALLRLKLHVSNEKHYSLPLANDHFIAVIKTHYNTY